MAVLVQFSLIPWEIFTILSRSTLTVTVGYYSVDGRGILKEPGWFSGHTRDHTLIAIHPISFFLLKDNNYLIFCIIYSYKIKKFNY
jgi:hypothetical protein